MPVIIKICLRWHIFINKINLNCKSISRHCDGGATPTVPHYLGLGGGGTCPVPLCTVRACLWLEHSFSISPAIFKLRSWQNPFIVHPWIFERQCEFNGVVAAFVLSLFSPCARWRSSSLRDHPNRCHSLPVEYLHQWTWLLMKLPMMILVEHYARKTFLSIKFSSFIPV